MISTAMRDLAIRRQQIEDGHYNMPVARVVTPRSEARNSGNPYKVNRTKDGQQTERDDGDACVLQHEITVLGRAVKRVRDESAKFDSFPSSKRTRASMAAYAQRCTFHQDRSPAIVSLPPPGLEFSNIPSLDASGHLIARCERLPSYTPCTSTHGLATEQLQLHHPFPSVNLPRQVRALTQRVGMKKAPSHTQLFSMLEYQAAQIALLKEQLNHADQRFCRIVAAHCNRPASQSLWDQPQHSDSNIELDSQLLHAAAAIESKSLSSNSPLVRHLGNTQQLRGINEMATYQSLLPLQEALWLAREKKEIHTYERQELPTLSILPSCIAVNGAPFDTRTPLPSKMTGHRMAMTEPRVPFVHHALSSTFSEPRGRNSVSELVLSAGSSRPCTIVENGGSISMALDEDNQKLSKYQCKVRQHLEFFVAREEDAESNIQGRKKQIQLGQVGLRCRECAKLPLHSRGKGSVYYPSRLDGIYQAAQNMAATHLSGSCSMISAKARQRLLLLRERRETASTKGKAYWGEACRQLGIYESENGFGLAAVMPSWTT